MHLDLRGFSRIYDKLLEISPVDEFLELLLEMSTVDCTVAPSRHERRSNLWLRDASGQARAVSDVSPYVCGSRWGGIPHKLVVTRQDDFHHVDP